MNFILRPRFFRYTIKAGRRVRGKSIHRNKRAFMGVVHTLLQVDRNISRAKATPNIKRAVNKYLSNWTANVQDAERILRAETIKVLRRSSTCAGLSVSDLALSLGRTFQQKYGLFYGEQCRRAHAADILDHVEVGPQHEPYGKWHSTMDDCRLSLKVAIDFFVSCLECLCDCFVFDASVSNELNTFGKELRELQVKTDPTGCQFDVKTG